MTEVQRLYSRYRDSGCDRDEAVAKLARRLDVDEFTVRRVLNRAEKDGAASIGVPRTGSLRCQVVAMPKAAEPFVKLRRVRDGKRIEVPVRGRFALQLAGVGASVGKYIELARAQHGGVELASDV
jgi:hypothetical protein